METEQQDKKILKTSMRSYLEGFYDWVLMPKLFKVPFYLFVVVVCSFIHGFQPLPQSYLSNKRNVLNVYFVKFGWGWTLLVLIPFISFTSSLYTSLNPLAILKHLRRMAVATCGWYIWVNLFVYIEELTGFCKGEEKLTSKRSCYQEGFYWDGFDISGHCFLLTYSALVISEELQPKLHWPSITSAVVQTNPENINGFQHRNIARLVTPFVDVFFSLCTPPFNLVGVHACVHHNLFSHFFSESSWGCDSDIYLVYHLQSLVILCTMTRTASGP